MILAALVAVEAFILSAFASALNTVKEGVEYESHGISISCDEVMISLLRKQIVVTHFLEDLGLAALDTVAMDRKRSLISCALEVEHNAKGAAAARTLKAVLILDVNTYSRL